jgi:hypothetical protein
MKTGTKSVLFGAHCFFLHPWFVAAAWWQLYGFPFDPRLWMAFIVHDIGYIGKPNMDGPEGERHPYLGAQIMALFGDRWYWFTLLHSRYLAKTLSLQPSRLCVADKLAIALTPAWLYLPMVRATGELREYMAHAQHSVKGNERINVEERLLVTSTSPQAWYAGVQSYCGRWAFAHRDDQHDTWTSDSRQRAVMQDGVWR